jgi:hypothetical protein
MATRLIRLLTLTILTAGNVGVGVMAQPRQAAATTHHNLEGVWDFSMQTPLQRPAQYADEAFFTPEEAVAFARTLRENVNNDRRGATAQADLIGPGISEVWFERGELAHVNGRIPTSLIVDPPDGRMPALTPEAQVRIAARRQVNARADAPEDRMLNERCLRAASGPPYFPSSDANTLRILESPHYVAITAEKFHETRIVSLDARPRLPSSMRSWAGDAIGQWDSDTLVVDTRNFTPEIGLTGNYDGNLPLTERFTRTDPTTLLYQVTVEDLTAFVRPWTVVVPMHKTNDPLYEFACHEGNYSLPNILRGARVEEQQSGSSSR